MAFDATGNLYVTEFSQDRIVRFDTPSPCVPACGCLTPRQLCLTAGAIASCCPSAAAAEADAIAATVAADSCPGGATLTPSTSGTCRATVTVRASDTCGNAASVDDTTAIDATLPTITVPPPLVVECAVPGDVPASDPRIADWLSLATACDDCGTPTLPHDAHLAFACACHAGAPTTIAWTSVDACGHVRTASSTVTLRATTSPVDGTDTDGWLRVARLPPPLRISWQERASAPTGHDLYAGTIGSLWRRRTYDHAAAACHLARVPVGRIDRFTDVPVPTTDTYYLVSPTDCAVEGGVGSDSRGTRRPISASGSPCGPMP